MKPFVTGILYLFVTSFVCAQQKGQTNAGPTQGTQQLLAAQTKMIADLAQRVKELEQRVQTLDDQREQKRASVESSKAQKLDLNQVKLDLAGFHRGCESDHDRAAAVAMAEGQPVLTYMGSAAMNCAERLQKIVVKIVEALDKGR